MRKFEYAVILMTAALLFVTIGYFLGRVPAAETFEISTKHIPEPPVVEVTVEVTVTAETTTTVTEYVTIEPSDEPSAESSEAPPVNSPSSKEPAPAPKTGPVNINTADLTELQRLPGVGPAIARRILDDRAANGLYRSVDDLMRVRGIGEKTLEKIKPLASVGE